MVEATRYLGIKRIEELSRSGEALSLAWNGVSRLGYAVDGVLSRRFDPFDLRTPATDPDNLRWASDHGVTAKDWEQDWLAAAFALAERISGIRIDQHWKERDHLVLRVCDNSQDEEIRPRPGLILKPEMWELVSRHPRIAAIAANPSPERLKEVSLATAELVVRAAKLEGSLIGRALDAIAQGIWGPPAQGLQEELAVRAAEFLSAADAVLEEGVDPDDDVRARLPSRETIIRRIKAYEAGHNQPRDLYRLLYARAFGLDEDELFELTAGNTGSHDDDEWDALELARATERLGVHPGDRAGGQRLGASGRCPGDPRCAEPGGAARRAATGSGPARAPLPLRPRQMRRLHRDDLVLARRLHSRVVLVPAHLSASVDREQGRPDGHRQSVPSAARRLSAPGGRSAGPSLAEVLARRGVQL
ncbi:hypothetical protein ACQP2K_35840 [Microbispora siamensis]